MYGQLVSFIREAKDRHIPRCKPRSRRPRHPWMRGAKIKKQKVLQWQKWKRFKETDSAIEYDIYKMERNKLGDLIRSAKANYEKKLIGDMKHNPKLYHGHCRRTLKTKQGVTNVVNGNGVLTETEQETVKALNRYYHSVFTRDGGTFQIERKRRLRMWVS